MSLSIAYFAKHPEFRASRAPAPDRRDVVVTDAELELHRALVRPEEARLWIARGAALGSALSWFLSRIGLRDA